MKKIIWGLSLLILTITLGGCGSEVSDTIDSALSSQDKADLEVATKNDAGDGKLELLTTEINVEDNQLSFMTEGIDESRVTYIYVANKEVFAEKIKNLQDYTLDITGIKNAHPTDYKPKVQLFQYDNDKESGNMITFKQARYKVVE